MIIINMETRNGKTSINLYAYTGFDDVYADGITWLHCGNVHLEILRFDPYEICA